MLLPLRRTMILVIMLLTIPLVLGTVITAQAASWKTPPGDGEHWQGPALLCDITSSFVETVPETETEPAIGDVTMSYNCKSQGQYMTESPVEFTLTDVPEPDFLDFTKEDLDGHRFPDAVVNALTGSSAFIGVNTVNSFNPGTFITASVIALYIVGN